MGIGKLHFSANISQIYRLFVMLRYMIANARVNALRVWERVVLRSKHPKVKIEIFSLSAVMCFLKGVAELLLIRFLKGFLNRYVLRR